MSIRAAEYAEAVMALAAEGASSVVIAEGLTRTLAARGHRRLAPRILRELEARMDRKTRRERVTLTVAEETDAERHRKDITEALTALGAEKADETRTDGRIVGGFVLESGERRRDASHRNALHSLYQRLIATP